MTTVIDPEVDVTVREPGVHEMSDEVYHADPVPGGSLSASGARKLLPPSCPALFRYWADNGSPPNAEYDFGHAAHKMVLGAGPELAVVDAPDWRTKAAREQRADAYAAGKVPVLRDEHDRVVEMANVLREHPIASALLSNGQPERSLFWIDQPTGIWRRARLDWLPASHGSRLLIADYKTTKSAAPKKIESAVYDYGYHIQAATYLEGVLSLDLADDAVFLLIFQEKTPPYLVTVVEPDAMALRIGRVANRQAVEIYRDCTASGIWPGYSDDIELVGVPRWIEQRFIEENL